MGHHVMHTSEADWHIVACTLIRPVAKYRWFTIASMQSDIEASILFAPAMFQKSSIAVPKASCMGVSHGMHSLGDIYFSLLSHQKWCKALPQQDCMLNEWLVDLMTAQCGWCILTADWYSAYSLSDSSDNISCVELVVLS